MKMINNLLRLFTSSSSFRRLSTLQIHSLLNDLPSSGFPYRPTSITSPASSSSSSSSATFRFLKTSSSRDFVDGKHDPFSENEERDISNGWEEGETSDGWEDEDETEPEYADGGDGGGVVLNGLPWGERAFSIALEVLSQFGDDIKLFAFKTTPRGYVYVRLDKLSHK
ncbi:hypothetical protein L484_026443 [Morus notabilis]|uniref:Uncharacterized protein n=2 Tax=Morus notabilis TaxID=981085 RepID=W9QNY1_9ROSA|nr:hypothetical protein L484_026443 [Morus notabilis]